MRLICPNCGAQYEVDDAVIPEAGRDVQCSACGRLWFQKSHTMLEAEEGELREPLAAPEGWDIPGADAPGKPALPEPAGAAEPAAAMPEAEDPDDAALARALAGIAADEAAPAEEAVGNAAAATEPEPEGPEPEPAAVPAPAPAPAAAAPPQRRTLDDSLLAILREEAEREARARRAEGTAAPFETQEEMNLEPPPAAAASRAAAKLAGIAAAPTAQQVPDFSDLSVPDAAETETRAETDEERFADLNEREDTTPGGAPRGRGRLPDIEQINSTLRASADRAGEAAAHDTPQVLARQRSGFRLGFTLVMGLAAVLAALYGFAPRLGAAVPPLASALDTYVGAVNDGRVWLDGQLRGVIETLQPHTGG
ncbi:zinc-ribbon domain-containing protein [Paenirhodobacter ferrireducens]|nr:zinc-ribbon domain-containing protein [Sinirhodobacter ferrireducens]